MSAVIDLATHRRQRTLKRTRDAMRCHPVYDALDAWRSDGLRASMGPEFVLTVTAGSEPVTVQFVNFVSLGRADCSPPCDTEPA